MDAVFSALLAGEAVLLATDTVYGLAAAPGSPGIERIYKLKRRPENQALAWLVSGEDMLLDLAENLPKYALRLAEAFWPGAVTLVVPARTGGTLAVRCPDSRVCLAAIDALNGPLACTSANLHGEPTPTRKRQLPEGFRALCGYAELPDTCGDVPSTIVDCTAQAPRVLREGPVQIP